MGNGTQMTAVEKKISSQIAFNSFMTGVNVYTNMKIESTLKEANSISQSILTQNIKQINPPTPLVICLEILIILIGNPFIKDLKNITYL